jgi:hypothetical protein
MRFANIFFALLLSWWFFRMRAYCRVLRALAEKSVVIRILETVWHFTRGVVVCLFDVTSVMTSFDLSCAF